eukprot:g7438.t1
MLLLDDGCYANLYTNQTKAFKVRIVGFTGVSKYDVYDYTDACHTLYRPKRRALGSDRSARLVPLGRQTNSRCFACAQHGVMSELYALRSGRLLCRVAKPPEILHMCGRQLLPHGGDNAEVLFRSELPGLAVPDLHLSCADRVHAME